jgi:hypothetical protein
VTRFLEICSEEIWSAGIGDPGLEGRAEEEVGMIRTCGRFEGGVSTLGDRLVVCFDAIAVEVVVEKKKTRTNLE